MSGKHFKKVVLVVVLFLSALNAVTVATGPSPFAGRYTPMEGCTTQEGGCPE